MGCGCGGGGQKAMRPTKNLIKSSSGILKAVSSYNSTKPPEAKESAQSMSDERRKVEKLRRDAILRALGRPQ